MPALSAVLVYASSSDIVMAAFIFGMVAVVGLLMWIIGMWIIGKPSSVPPGQRKPSQFPPTGGRRIFALERAKLQRRRGDHRRYDCPAQRTAGRAQGRASPVGTVGIEPGPNFKHQAEISQQMNAPQ
jgi:hypothetical protein